MDINEVSEILGLCNFLRVPKHVFITDEKVSSHDNGVTFYRGLQPKSKRDSIFLTAQTDETTPIHEALHAMGLDELGAEVLTRIIMRKNQIKKRFPLITELTKKNIHYRKAESDEDYPEAHLPKYEGRVEHYILEW